MNLDTDCVLDAHRAARQVRVPGAFGRALHGAQDFYSHSNWADAADPARPIGADNPPGLNLPAPSPILDLRGDGAPTVPAELTTGASCSATAFPASGRANGGLPMPHSTRTSG